MSKRYLVEQEINNGYRCCCECVWTIDSLYFDTEEEVLAHVPKEPQIAEGEFGSDLVHYCATDQFNGNIIVNLHLTWPNFHYPNKHKKYLYSKWSGELDGKPFAAYKGLAEGETWDDVCASVAK